MMLAKRYEQAYEVVVISRVPKRSCTNDMQESHMVENVVGRVEQGIKVSRDIFAPNIYVRHLPHDRRHEIVHSTLDRRVAHCSDLSLLEPEYVMLVMSIAVLGTVWYTNSSAATLSSVGSFENRAAGCCSAPEGIEVSAISDCGIVPPSKTVIAEVYVLNMLRSVFDNVVRVGRWWGKRGDGERGACMKASEPARLNTFTDKICCRSHFVSKPYLSLRPKAAFYKS